MPDWEFILWDKNCLKDLNSDWVNEAYSTKKYAFAADYIRLEGGNLAASKIRNLECPSYEICLIDYGCGKFNRKIHIMEQYP